MKPSVILFLLVVGISTISVAQDYGIPSLFEHRPGIYYWPDSITEHQKEYWEEGNLKVEYVDIENGKKLRKEYFKGGPLKLTVEVRQEYRPADTVLVVDPETFVESYEIDIGYTDVLDGKYVEYALNSSNHYPKDGDMYITYSQGQLITTGQYLNGIRQGEWKVFGRYTLVGNYNDNGQLEGQYTEYYTDRDRIPLVKVKGQFGLFKKSKMYWEFHKGYKYKYRTYKQIRRVGTWKFYDKDGKLIETITYKQKK